MTFKEACIVTAKVLEVCAIIIVWLIIRYKIHDLQDSTVKDVTALLGEFLDNHPESDDES